MSFVLRNASTPRAVRVVVVAGHRRGEALASAARAGAAAPSRPRSPAPACQSTTEIACAHVRGRPPGRDSPACLITRRSPAGLPTLKRNSKRPPRPDLAPHRLARLLAAHRVEREHLARHGGLHAAAHDAPAAAERRSAPSGRQARCRPCMLALPAAEAPGARAAAGRTGGGGDLGEGRRAPIARRRRRRPARVGVRVIVRPLCHRESRRRARAPARCSRGTRAQASSISGPKTSGHGPAVGLDGVRDRVVDRVQRDHRVERARLLVDEAEHEPEHRQRRHDQQAVRRRPRSGSARTRAPSISAATAIENLVRSAP